MAKKAKLGIEKQKNGKWAVVDYDTVLSSFTKVLTAKEQKDYAETGKLPVGVKETKQYDTVAIFDSNKGAADYLQNGKDKRPIQAGIFRSIAQAVKARKLCSK